MGLAVGRCRTVQPPVEHHMLSMQSMDVATGHRRDSVLYLSITLAVEYHYRMATRSLGPQGVHVGVWQPPHGGRHYHHATSLQPHCIMVGWHAQVLADHWCCLQSMDLAAVLRRLPHSLQRCPEVKFALQAHDAASLGDGLAFARLHSQGTWMQQAIMLPRLQQACSVRIASQPEIAACILPCACSPGCM